MNSILNHLPNQNLPLRQKSRIGCVLTLFIILSISSGHVDATPTSHVRSNSDEHTDKIYWTELDRVRRADLDGSNVVDLFVGTVYPTGIAIDIDHGKLYWTDEETNRIKRADLDGSNIEDLVAGLDSPYDIALDIARRKMYWSDNGTGRIQWADLDGSNVDDVVTGLNFPKGIALDLLEGRVYWAEWGSIRRADLDGYNVQHLVSADADGVALDHDLKKMYWTEKCCGVEEGRIRRANLDGSNVELIRGGYFLPNDIAVFGESIYWTSYGERWIGEGIIHRANLDGSNAEEIFWTYYEPMGLAFDANAGTMYWTELLGRIRRADLDTVNGVQDLLRSLAKIKWIFSHSLGVSW